MRNSKQSVCFALVLAFLMQAVAAQTVGRVIEPKAPKDGLKWEGKNGKNKGVLVPLASLEAGDKITIDKKQSEDPDYYVLLEVGGSFVEVTVDGKKKAPERSNMKVDVVNSPYVIQKPLNGSGYTNTAVAFTQEIGSWMNSWLAKDDETWKPAGTKSENDGNKVRLETLGIPMLGNECSSPAILLKNDLPPMVAVGWTGGEGKEVKIEEVIETLKVNNKDKVATFSSSNLGIDRCYKMIVTDNYDVSKTGFFKVTKGGLPASCQKRETKISDENLQKSIQNVMLASCLLKADRNKWAFQAYQLVAGEKDYYPAKLMSLGLRRGLPIR